jgi:hypothetical protein
MDTHRVAVFRVAAQESEKSTVQNPNIETHVENNNGPRKATLHALVPAAMKPAGNAIAKGGSR